MAYCALVRNRLVNANFMQDYDGNVATWRQLAEEALDYIRTHENDPRPDDVAPHLALALETNKVFRQAMSQHKLGAKHWFTDFADLILDRLWSKLVGGGA